MSDGPHRSLKLRPHWKKFAEKAASQAYSFEEVEEELKRAIDKDWKNAGLDALEDFFKVKDQGSLFGDDRIERAQYLIDTAEGSAIALIAVECAIEAIADGKHGTDAYNLVVENVGDEFFLKQSRSIQEHWQRKAKVSEAKSMSNRLQKLRSEFHYSRISKDRTPLSGASINRRAARRTGLDEGPSL
ncbi:hypothetical protein [Thalassospira povalilytica]|uniref:hypothetical protein n=1 Tax=Thalassospira povalilytica TaxID=732237 RepID=UPI003AA9535E